MTTLTRAAPVTLAEFEEIFEAVKTGPGPMGDYLGPAFHDLVRSVVVSPGHGQP